MFIKTVRNNCRQEIWFLKIKAQIISLSSAYLMWNVSIVLAEMDNAEKKGVRWAEIRRPVCL